MRSLITILPAFIAALMTMALVEAGVAAVRPTVTTRLTFTDPWSPAVPAVGRLNGTFRATHLPDGSWSVEATFVPRNLTVGYRNSDFGWIMRDALGTASATVTARTGVGVPIAASGLYYYRLPSNGGQRVNLTVYGTITVDANGVVTAQGVHLQ